jgi:hypothetical protein
MYGMLHAARHLDRLMKTDKQTLASNPAAGTASWLLKRLFRYFRTARVCQMSLHLVWVQMVDGSTVIDIKLLRHRTE